MTNDPGIPSRQYLGEEDSATASHDEPSLSESRRILLAFYSMSGNTRALASQLRLAVASDLEEIREPNARLGFVGESRALVDSMLRRAPTIQRPEYDPE